MDRDELIRQLIGTFLEELDEHIDALNRDLLAMEKEIEPAARRALINTIFRTIHSLKGASRAVDIYLLETVCHRLEEILGALRDSGAEFGPAAFRLFFAAADGFTEAARRLRADESLDGSSLVALLPEIDSFELPALPDGQPPALPQSMEPTGLMEMEQSEPPDILSDSSIDLFISPEITARLATLIESGNPGRGASSEGDSTVSHDSQDGHDGDMARTRAAVQPGGQGSFEYDSGRAGGSKTLRVTATKLDELLTRSGELMLAIRRTDQLMQELDSLHESVRRWLDTTSMDSRSRGRAPSARLRDAGASADAGVRAQLQKLVTRIDQITASAARNLRAVEQAAAYVDDDVHRLRLMPFGAASRGLERTVRDLAVDCGKQVTLRLEGADVEIDRSVLDGLRDPLLHLTRNAVEHGVEQPEARARAGKSPAAVVTVAAALRGVQVEVVVADDGAGISFEAIRAQARKRGMAVPKSERELIQYLFLSGFSTAAAITRVAGRGIGLDIVKHQVESLHGTIHLTTESGKGTRFVMTLPLTLTTIRVLLVRLRAQVYAIPLTGVVALVRLEPDDLKLAGGWQAFTFQGMSVPLISLAPALGLSDEPWVARGKVPAVVVAAEGSFSAFVVDEFLAEQDIVVKNLGRRIRQIKHISGGAILEDGQVALVLNTADLVSTAMRRGAAPALTGAPREAKRHILIADDSLTTRTLEKTLLENAGYVVRVAVDGLQAWQVLHEEGADLLVSDVEMPRMDGFSLTEAVRASPELRDLPVILLTSLDNEVNRQRGLAVGANAYLSKSVFDQTELLNTIKQLV